MYSVLKMLLVDIYVNVHVQPDNRSCSKNTAGEITLPLRSLLSLEQEMRSSASVIFFLIS